jgi:polyphosphate glucokinase
MKVLGIDIGGSGIKGAIVDTTTGALLSDRHRLATPKPSTPKRMAATVRALVDEFDYGGTVGCCFPAVVIHGEVRTAGNIHNSWLGTRADTLFEDATGLPFVMCNDADAAAIAEMRLGAGVGLKGMIITITIGTGLGSGVFSDGQLVPNIELGHMPGKDGEPIETYAGNRARKVNDLDWREWGQRFDYFLGRAARVMSPDHFILGGGASKRLHEFEDEITVRIPVHVAHFRNNAGIIGAAVAAVHGEAATSVR